MVCSWSWPGLWNVFSFWRTIQILIGQGDWRMSRRQSIGPFTGQTVVGKSVAKMSIPRFRLKSAWNEDQWKINSGPCYTGYISHCYMVKSTLITLQGMKTLLMTIMAVFGHFDFLRWRLGYKSTLVSLSGYSDKGRITLCLKRKTRYRVSRVHGLARTLMCPT